MVTKALPYILVTLVTKRKDAIEIFWVHYILLSIHQITFTDRKEKNCKLIQIIARSEQFHGEVIQLLLITVRILQNQFIGHVNMGRYLYLYT